MPWWWGSRLGREQHGSQGWEGSVGDAVVVVPRGWEGMDERGRWGRLVVGQAGKGVAQFPGVGKGE